ncbi:MAG: GNAT family N-acetyltransferase [Actinomycetota bacterium]|nr:GNAT family N-acetyltransferase [Actinomycetota bacterium]
MFISKATRHDRDDIRELIEAQGWDSSNVGEGTTLIARAGTVAGCVRLIEVETRQVVLDDFVVREEQRGQGLGRRLMEAAMNNRGGTLYLCCHDDVLGFYEKLGFSRLDFEDLPQAVKDYFIRVDDYPTDHGHEHFFLKAR